MWPYVEFDSGIVAKITFDAAPDRGVVADLTREGRVSSQKVKFSHHVSGIAHFSGTGKVRTEIRTQSFALGSSRGKLFHLQAQHLEAFEPLRRLKARRAYLTFLLDDPMIKAVEIRGQWLPKSDVAEGIRPGADSIGPVTRVTERASGKHSKVFLYSPPLGNPLIGRYCMVECLPLLPGTEWATAGVVFTGGYEPHEVPKGTDPAAYGITHGLAALFPAVISDQLRERLGTIDLSGTA